MVFMQAFRNNLATIVVGIAVAALLAVVFAFFGSWQTTDGGGFVVVVHDSEGNEQRLPLDSNKTLEIRTSLGRNVVVVENGTARITEADCPNGSCMQQQPISQPGQQLICLPHRLWVEVVEPDGASSVLDTGAVTWTDDSDEVDLVAR